MDNVIKTGIFLSVKSKTGIVNTFKVICDSPKPADDYEILDEVITENRGWRLFEDWKYRKLQMVDSSYEWTRERLVGKYFYMKYQGTFPIKMNTSDMIIGSYDDCMSLNQI